MPDGAETGEHESPTPSESELRQIAEASARALAALDQYALHSRLPRDRRWLDQGSHWDEFNQGHRAGEQERTDPVVISKAWNELQQALLELEDATDRLRRYWRLTTSLPLSDRRVGAYDRVSQRPDDGDAL